MASSRSFIAGGDIYPCRFVKPSTTAAGKCLAATGATDRILGVSGRGTRRNEYVDTSGKHAASGEPAEVFCEGEECFLELSGTVTLGDLLKSDTAGQGLTASADTNWTGAVALSGGSSGDIIPVRVQIVQRSS